jgi:hypothetical protein
MKRVLRLLVAPAMLVLAAAALAGNGLAKTASGPFYLVPSATNECHNVKNCIAVTGPWVRVPASGEATFLFGCKVRRGFVIGGTDARASSTNVRVWFDANLGAPIGIPPGTKVGGAVILFHAVANNGKQGWFQPTLGCVSLTQKSKRSTVSAVPGTHPSAALDLRAEQVTVSLAEGLTRRATTLACPKSEQVVGSWNALALSTLGPPAPSYANAVTVNTVVAGGKVHATFRLNRLFGVLAPRAFIQIGAMCEP